jgi:hypothetical protein
VTVAEDLADRVADPATALPGVPEQLPDAVAAPRGVTALGLPYPTPTDPLADAWQHLSALSTAVEQLLAAPGQVWGPYATTSNAGGGIWLPTTGLSQVTSANLVTGYRGGTVVGNGYFFLFIIGGTWPSNQVFTNVYSSTGDGPLANFLTEMTMTLLGSPG